MITNRKGGNSENQKPAQTVSPEANVHNNSLLDSILSQKLSIVPKVVNSDEISEIRLGEWLHSIRSGAYKNQVDKVRNAKDKDTAGSLKKELPAITVSGLFSNGLKENPVQHSGVLCVDIDVKHPDIKPTDTDEIKQKKEKENNVHLFDLKELQKLKNRLQEDNTVIAYHYSASGKGFAVYVAIDPAQHLNSFLTIQRDYLSKYGVVIDKACKNENRLRMASADADLYLRAEEVDIYQAEDFKRNDAPIIPLSETELQGAALQAQRVTNEYLKRASDPKVISFFDNYDNWLKTMFALKQIGEPGREMAHKLSQIVLHKYHVKETNTAFDNGRNTPIDYFLNTAKKFGIESEPIRAAIDYTLRIYNSIITPDEYDTIEDIEGYYLKPEHLPTYSCVLHKGVTGNGATTSFLNDDSRGIRVLIAPYITIIEAKAKGRTNVIPVHGRINGGEIAQMFEDVVKRGMTPVIVGTYDSFKKITNVLPKLCTIGEVALMVDELHHLVEDFGYKPKAIAGVLENIKEYKYSLFVSATPPFKLFTPVELQSLPRIKYNFPDIPPVQVLNRELSRPADGLIRKLKSIAKNEKFRNNEYHIFVNSVRVMKRIYNELTQDEELQKVGVSVRCVYSKTNKEAVATNSLPNSSINDAPAQFNIYTSCAYDGIDIHISNEDYKAGKRAFIFLISSGSQTTMQTNIFTQLVQVSGRIRYTPEQRKAGATAAITHYYSRSKSRSVSKFYQVEDIKKDLKQLQEISGIDAENKFIANILPDLIINGKITAIPLMNELFRLLISSMYCSDGRITEAMRRYGLEVVERERQEVEAIAEDKPKKKPFKEVVETLLQSYNSGAIFSKESNHDNAIFKDSVGRSFVDVMQVLGAEKITADYPVQLKRKLVIHSDASEREKIYRLLKQRLITGKTYKGDQLKKILSEVYDDLGINRAVKLTSFSFYWCDLMTTREDEGKGPKVYKVKRWQAVAPAYEESDLIELIA